MKTKLGILCILVTFIIVSVPVSVPGADLNPNGFPSGPHFNLNIHGKNANFACPPQEYQLDESGNPTSIPVYGNSIFVPLSTDSNIEVYVESGKKGPKSSPAITELQVTDWCSGFGDDAEVRFLLPKNDAGYDVYARILAKPTNNPKMTFVDPTLVYAEDESGYDLTWLGFFVDGGFQTPGGFEFTRSKGKSTAQNITGLFTWSGDVYYISEPESGPYTPEEFCMIDNDSDGLYDGFYSKGSDACLEGYTLVTLYKVQHENEWVFNIADFVGMFYGLKNEEARLVQLRFYPRQ